VNSTHGWVPGDQNGVGALFLHSTDGGQTWRPCPHDGYVTLPMGIGMARYSDGTVNGVVGGIGIGRNFTSMEYTDDGLTFHPPPNDPDFVGESQDSKPIVGVKGGFALPGQYTDYKGKNYNGLAASFDGGKSWQNYDMGYAYPWARYGHFPSASVWYISAGVWPGDLEWDADPEAKVISRNLRIHKEHGVQFRHQMQLQAPSRKLLQDTGYMAAISKTTDGGKTWTTVFNDTGNYYLNDIDCPTTTDCWAVGESGSDSPQPGVRILHTSNGGQSWTVQMYLNDPDYSLMDIAMLNTTEGWAVGGYLSRSITGEFFHTVDGGNHWVQSTPLADEYATALSLYYNGTGPTYNGWASALTIEGQSSILIYK